ncbi:hypothetical protein GCM10029964_067030 [Kibdelosporangium lantanae]
MSIPVVAAGQPGTYLSPPLGHASEVSSVDPTPAFPFGHGMGYDTFDWSPVRCETTTWATDGDVVLSLDVHNPGTRPGADVVQLYLHDPVAQVTRPVVRLIGYAKVRLAPGETTTVTFHVPADATSFTGLAGRRVVEPGAVQLRVAHSSANVHEAVDLELVGPLREVDHTRRWTVEVTG